MLTFAQYQALMIDPLFLGLVERLSLLQKYQQRFKESAGDRKLSEFETQVWLMFETEVDQACEAIDDYFHHFLAANER